VTPWLRLTRRVVIANVGCGRLVVSHAGKKITLSDLVIGSELKGVPGDWQLFAVTSA
jgi:hypothetical protein